MNKDFEKRQAQVLDVLALLSKKAAAEKEALVFIGGSAIQAAILSRPRRLSVDLDAFYAGDASKLLAVLKPEYKVSPRPTKRTELFDFYNVVKDGVQVKVDVTRFPLVEKEAPHEARRLGTKKFEALVATPDYLLASKLSTLAIGTVGRDRGQQLDFLKDVFDSDCLLSECGVSEKTLDYFGQICKAQNKIRETKFSAGEIIDSAVKALLESALTDDSRATIKKGDLGNFNEYYFGGALKKNDYWTMAYRLAAYLNAFKQPSTGEMLGLIKAIEKTVNEKYAEKSFIENCEKELSGKGVDSKQLHELKIVAPKALAYFYAFYFPAKIEKEPAREGLVTTDTPGVYNPRHS